MWPRWRPLQAYILGTLDVLVPLLIDPELTLGAMKILPNFRSIEWNNEAVTRWHFQHKGLLPKVARYPRVMYAVRNHTDATRWSVGIFNETLGYYIKYMGEYKNMEFARMKFAQAGEDWKKFMRTTALNSAMPMF